MRISTTNLTTFLWDIYIYISLLDFTANYEKYDFYKNIRQFVAIELELQNLKKDILLD